MIRLVTPSVAANVLPLATLKAHLRIDDTTEDTLLGIYAASAVRAIETRTGRSLGPATYQMTLAAVPAIIDIGVPNVTGITEFTIVDEDGVEHTLDPADYVLTTSEYAAVVEPAPGVTWPTAGRVRNACEITFTAGFATVPEDITAALLLTATAMHRERGDAEIPNGARNLTAPYLTGGWY